MIQDLALGRRSGNGATERSAPPCDLIGSDRAFLDVLRLVPAMARADHPVLISGETGTGKELVARTLHALSRRASGAFVPVNCGALPDTLFEDELFGHERGAFTDARTRRAGLISCARGGTLFLDEVDSLSPRGQVALLRVLQDGRFRPLGSDSEQQVDVRFIAATNAPIDDLVETGDFRSDLHYRLNVLPLALPPLRERRADILTLARHFLRKHDPGDGRRRELTPRATASLLAYDWPGNVRELESAIIRALHLSASEHIHPADFRIPALSAAGAGDRREHGRTNGREHRGEDGRGNGAADPEPEATFGELKQGVIAAFEQDYLRRLLTRHQGNVTRAARVAGKERRALGKLLRKYDIDPGDFTPAD